MDPEGEKSIHAYTDSHVQIFKTSQGATGDICLQKLEEFVSVTGIKKNTQTFHFAWNGLLALLACLIRIKRHTAGGTANGKLVGQANWNKNTKITT